MSPRIVVIVLSLIVGKIAYGQIPESSQIGRVLLLDSGKSKLLERQKILKRPNFFYFEKLESSTKVQENSSIEMVVRVMDNSVNPIASVRLYRIKQNRLFKCRVVPVKKQKTSGKDISSANFDGLAIRKNQYKYQYRQPLNPHEPRPEKMYNQLSLINYDKMKRIYFKSSPFGAGLLKIELTDLKPGSYVIKVQADDLNWNLFDVVEMRRPQN